MKYNYCPKCAGKLQEKEVEHRQRMICKDCGFIFYQNPLPSVGIIVIENGKCLFIKRGKEPGKNTWAPPSGFMELNETLQEAALRELKEETGLEARLTEQLGAYHEKNNVYGDVLTIIYAAEKTGGELKAGDDALDAKYFPLTSLPHIHFQVFKDAIEEYRIRHSIKTAYAV